MDEEEKKVGEMFCGIGGFRLGFCPQSYDCAHESEHQAEGSGGGNGLDAGRHDGKASNYRVVWANDNNKYACQVYRRNFGSAELVEADIRDIKTADIPDIDILCAGFPCQTFSYAGERTGTGTSGGALFAQIARVASAKRPDVLFLENVRGLLSSGGGRDFAVIIRVLGGLGYILQWECLDSQYYGVPQHRERVFIIGHLGRKCFRQVFPLGQDAEMPRASPATTRGEGQRFRRGSVRGFGGLGGETEAVLDTVNARYYKGGPENLIIQQHSFSGKGGRGRGFRTFDDYCPTLATQMGTGGNNVPMVVPKPTCVVAEAAVPPGRRPRRLTPVECERLQAFPDDWTKEGLTADGKTVQMSDTQRYKLVGNSVTTSVVRYVAERLF